MATKEKILERKAVGKEAGALLEMLGANSYEINILLLIAYAESLLDWSAKGTGGELGLWQIETASAEKEAQARNALTQLRGMEDALSKYSTKDWYAALSPDWKDKFRLLRAAWQMGKTGPAKSLEYWLNGKPGDAGGSVRKRFEDAPKDKLPGETDKDAKIRYMTQGGRLGALDFIAYCKTKLGANESALLAGMRKLNEAGEATGWDMYTLFEVSPAAAPKSETGEAIFGTTGAGDSDESLGWLGRTIKSLFAGVREGLGVMFGQSIKYILPPALLVLGGGLAFRFLRDMWRRGSGASR